MVADFFSLLYLLVNMLDIHHKENMHRVCVFTCDDSSVLPTTRYVHRLVSLQPELIGHIAFEAALSKREDGSCIF